MRRFARATVYKIARLNILIAGGLLAGPQALAQETAVPAPPASGAPSTPAEAPPPAPAAVLAPSDPALQGRVDALEVKTAELQRSLARAEAEASAPRSTTTFQTDEGGFAVTSADRQYQVRFKGLLQIDGRRIFGDEALGNSVDTFLVRRARPILAGTVLGLTDFNFTPDFGNNTVALLDAYLDTHPFPWLRLRVGKFKPPVGLERLQADQDVTFIERGLTQNLSAQRDVGLELWGDIAGGIVRYEAAVLNGNPDNGLNDIDSDHAKSFAGRLLLQPLNTGALRAFGRLGLGIAAETGNEKGSATNTWVGAFKSTSQSTIFSYLTDHHGHDRLLAGASHARQPAALLLPRPVRSAGGVGTGAPGDLQLRRDGCAQQLGWKRGRVVRRRGRRQLRGGQAPPRARSRFRRLRRAGDRRALRMARRRPRGIPDRGRSDQVGEPGA